MYSKKAELFIRGAHALLKRKNWQSAAVLSVHATISACDAMTAKFLQCKHSGARHEDVLNLLRKLPLKETSELKRKVSQVSKVLAQKSDIEYGSRIAKAQETQTMINRASRIVDWTRKHVG